MVKLLKNKQLLLYGMGDLEKLTLHIISKKCMDDSLQNDDKMNNPYKF